MSRIGRQPIAVPGGVEVKVAGKQVSIKGPLGKLDWPVREGVSVAVDKGHVQVNRSGDDRKLRALHGLVRAELSNMIVGVTKGYEKSLEITGVGYKAQLQGKVLSVSVGYINPITYAIPAGIEIKVDKQTLLTVRGADKRMVGQVAANIRGIKPPDVYKQKGIRYTGELLRKKEGKTGK